MLKGRSGIAATDTGTRSSASVISSLRRELPHASSHGQSRPLCDFPHGSSPVLSRRCRPRQWLLCPLKSSQHHLSRPTRSNRWHTTSLAIGTGSKAFTTQAGLAYTNGARVRATATAGATGWLEGVATYSGTTLTITSDKTSGTGTGTAWNLNVVGEPGAGDLSSANNLSDVASAATALANLGGVAKSANLSDVASAATSLSNLGLTALASAAVGHIPGEPSNRAAVAGEVGELAINSFTTVALSASGVAAQLTSLSLTAGDWDVSALIQWSGGGAMVSTDYSSIISTNSTPSVTGANSITGLPLHNRVPSGNDWALIHSHTPYHQRLAAAATIYLHGSASFSSSPNPSGSGWLCARRIR